MDIPDAVSLCCHVVEGKNSYLDGAVVFFEWDKMVGRDKDVGGVGTENAK